MRTTKNISITLSPALLKQAVGLAKREGRTQSELFREALRRYIEDKTWRELRTYGSLKAQSAGMSEEDIPHLIQEYRKRK